MKLEFTEFGKMIKGYAIMSTLKNNIKQLAIIVLSIMLTMIATITINHLLTAKVYYQNYEKIAITKYYWITKFLQDKIQRDYIDIQSSHDHNQIIELLNNTKIKLTNTTMQQKGRIDPSYNFSIITSDNKITYEYGAILLTTIFTRIAISRTNHKTFQIYSMKCVIIKMKILCLLCYHCM
ncbi:MAG: hypothetical protein MZV65_02050 [Chromatiales bacterium]|nr:hypothetical protein [Chromatiales bacterium]